MNVFRPHFYRRGSAASLVFACVMFALVVNHAEVLAEALSSAGSAEEVFVDRSHRYLSRRVMRVAESINNVVSSVFLQDEDKDPDLSRRFYGNMRTAYEVRGSRVRVTPRIILMEREPNKYKIDFSARLHLPNITKKLRFDADSYDNDNDTMEDIFSSRYRQTLERGRGEGTTAGLTYFFTDRTKRQLSLSTGLRFHPAPSPKIRLRARFRKTFDAWSVESGQSGFWNDKDGFGERTEITFDRPLGEIYFLRFHSSVVWSEVSHGLDWGQMALFGSDFSPRRSGAFKLGVRGYTHPSTIVEQYLVRLSYRQRLSRDWLFMEIEPGLDFFREDDFEISPLINIKFEMVFGSFNRIP